MTAPSIILLDVIPVLAMVLVIVCVPLLGDGPSEDNRGIECSHSFWGRR
jgi:hypothetical protein